jgi:hypothetical protein
MYPDDGLFAKLVNAKLLELLVRNAEEPVGVVERAEVVEDMRVHPKDFRRGRRPG